MGPQKRGKGRNVFIAVIMTVQTIVTLMFLMFAFYQKAEADTQRWAAEENALAARKAEMMAGEERGKSEKIIDSLTTALNRLTATTEKK